MLESLRAIVQEVGAIRELPKVLAVIVKRVRDAMQTGICSIYLQDPVDGHYVLMATEGLNPEAVGKVRLANNQGLVGLVAAREEPINLEHAETHPNFAYFPETGEEAFSSFMGAPIIHHRRVLGVLVVQQKQLRRFDESEEAFLVTICAQLAAVIAHAEATGVLAELTHDSGSTEPRPREAIFRGVAAAPGVARSEEHTSELQSRGHLVCRLLLEKKTAIRKISIATLNRNRHSFKQFVSLLHQYGINSNTQKE